MTEFIPQFPRDEDTDEEVMIGFTRSEFYDVVYAARSAQIRYKRLRTQVRKNVENLDVEYVSWKIDDCTEMIRHYNAMEDWLRNKYYQAFGENW